MSFFLRDRFKTDAEVARDRETLRVPMVLMDSASQLDAAGNQNHNSTMTDEQREARAKTRDAYAASLRDAWRSPAASARFTQAGKSICEDGADADPDRARTEMVRKTCDAWRRPVHDAAEPDRVPPPNYNILPRSRTLRSRRSDALLLM
jgi:hypothetical protein